MVRDGRRGLRLAVSLLLLVPAAGAAAPPPARVAPTAASAPAVDPRLFQALRYRMLGPTRGGRSTAVAGIPDQPHTFFLGTSGGLWKTVNAGQTWANVTDGQLEVGSIGAVAVADSDPNVVYLGTGQACLRGNVSSGVGVYKSTDGGKTWSHSGLRDVGQIAHVRVDPRNADVVYVASVGDAFGPNVERGVFRSRDGGKTWQNVFFVSAKTGVTDLAMDVTNPRVLYAAAWTGDRKPWTIVSGSAESGLFKTTDGGETWKRLDGGLPTGVVGKIGVAVSPADPRRVWALVEHADKGGLYRSDDGGETWTYLQTNARRRLYQRTWYFTHIFADPRDANRVYVLNVDSFRSDDGGRTFEEIKTLPHGDGHDMWINPRDNALMIVGNDGGGTVSVDGGQGWSTLNNQPTAEIYYVTVDRQFPYRVYGAQQDNTTISLPSRFGATLSATENWRNVGGCESGHVAVDPRDPSVVYAGCYGGEITRVNLATGERRDILTYPQMEVGLAPRELRYRFNWNAPIRVSAHDPRVLYHCSQHVHRSQDEGQTWQVVSPDLSRNQKDKQDYAGSPITYENTGVEVNSNILSFEESPHAAGELWAGSDDGLVHVTRDGGKTWQDVTPPGLAEWTTIQSIEISPLAPGRVFVAAHRYRLDDFRPLLYRTEDYGKTWTLLTDGRNGIPAGTPTRVVREDPDRKGLLYAGTEWGLYVSFDDGRRWQPFQQNLPIVPITDLRVHEKDLVVSTQGRSFWILDDLTPLHAMAATAPVPTAPALLPPRDAYRMRLAGSGFRTGSAENAPAGATIHYVLPTQAVGEVRLEILDAKGRTAGRFSSERETAPNPPEIFTMLGGYVRDTKLTRKAGLNRFVWDARYAVVDIVPDAILWGYTGGPKAAPGTYQVRLTVDGFTQTQPLRVLKDPRTSATSADFDEQLELMLDIRADLDRIFGGVRTARALREQARALAQRLEDGGASGAPAVRKAAEALAVQLTAIENGLMQTRNEADQDTENFPTQVDNQLAYVYGLAGETDGRPTAGQRERAADLKKEAAAILRRLDEVVARDVAALNALAADAGAAAVVVPRLR
jgi:photosystem II stability/assembly factor-like uncharacterized protein